MMTVFVPYDGSPLSRTALRRATMLTPQFDDTVSVVTVVPDQNVAHARENGWLDADEPFDFETIAAALESDVDVIAPDAAFRTIKVGRHAPTGAISTRLRRAAVEDDADLLVVGSAEAGGLVPSLLSVGSGVSADRSYDVYLVRSPDDADAEA